MRVWLAGSRTFGATVFRSLLNLPNIELVAISAPLGDMLARAAWDWQVPNSAELLSGRITNWNIDLIVSAQNYAWIPKEACLTAKYGAIGYHPSLLPRHRGRSPVEWTIAMEDAIAGGTVYRMDGGWDTGPIIAQDFCHVVPGWSASDLWRNELFPMGIRLLTEVLAGQWWTDHVQPQDERVATSEPPWEYAYQH